MKYIYFYQFLLFIITFATIGGNGEKDRLLTFGFIRECYEDLHYDLMDLVSQWVCNEIVYVRCASSLWMIEVNKILQT